MEKTIPVRYTKSDEEEAIKKVWERKEPIKEEKEESITISSDYKNWIIVGLVIVFSLVMVGYTLQDTGLQDNIRVIQEQTQNINKQNAIISNAQKSITGSLKQIDKSKEILQKSYHVTYQ